MRKNHILLRANLRKWEVDIPTFLRFAICALVFLGAAMIVGMKPREAHQYIYMLFCICAFAFLVDNVWITLFTLWSAFLYCYLKFGIGNIYLGNILYGLMLYYVIKVVFKKEHINMFINAVLLFCVANILYSWVQVLGYDFIFVDTAGTPNYDPMGFMANKGVTGMLYAVAIPLLATRTKWWYGSFLFIPLGLLTASTNVVAGIVGFLFVAWFKFSKKIFAVIIVILLLFGVFYATKIDKKCDAFVSGTERFLVWKKAMQDILAHPITGYGLDSYRHVTKMKPHTYADLTLMGDNKGYVTHWDNPHNLIISLWYEWGIIGLGIFIGYMLFLFNLFRYAIKTPNLLGLAGAIIASLVICMGHFPLHLARTAVFIVPLFALFECETRT